LYRRFQWKISRRVFSHRRIPEFQPQKKRKKIKKNGETLRATLQETHTKRPPDGSWKIYRDCFNSNVPPK